MFPNLKNNALNIGAKNDEAVKKALSQHKIKLFAEDVGGLHWVSLMTLEKLKHQPRTTAVTEITTMAEIKEK